MKLQFMQSQIARVKGIHIHVRYILSEHILTILSKMKKMNTSLERIEVKNMGYTKNHFIQRIKSQKIFRIPGEQH